MPSEDHESRALAILKAIGAGTIPLDHFTPDARWWWNGGIDIPVTEFRDLVGQLHEQMADRIAITPGLINVQGDSVWIEATSKGALKNGRIYSNRYVFLIHFTGEHVREVREYSDSAHVLATFDLSPAQGV